MVVDGHGFKYRLAVTDAFISARCKGLSFSVTPTLQDTIMFPHVCSSTRLLRQVASAATVNVIQMFSSNAWTRKHALKPTPEPEALCQCTDLPCVVTNSGRTSFKTFATCRKLLQKPSWLKPGCRAEDVYSFLAI